MTEGNGATQHVLEGKRLHQGVPGLFRTVCDCKVTLLPEGRCEIAYCHSHSLRYHDAAELQRLKEHLATKPPETREANGENSIVRVQPRVNVAQRKDPFARPAPSETNQVLSDENKMLREAIEAAIGLKNTKAFVILHQALRGEWLKSA